MPVETPQADPFVEADTRFRKELAVRTLAILANKDTLMPSLQNYIIRTCNIVVDLFAYLHNPDAPRAELTKGVSAPMMNRLEEWLREVNAYALAEALPRDSNASKRPIEETRPGSSSLNTTKTHKRKRATPPRRISYGEKPVLGRDDEFQVSAEGEAWREDQRRELDEAEDAAERRERLVGERE